MMISIRTVCIFLLTAGALAIPNPSVDSSPAARASNQGLEQKGGFVARELAVGHVPSVDEAREASSYQRDRDDRRNGRQRSFVVRCSSDDERRARCHVDGVVWNVQVERQVSGSPCVLGQTWGFDNDEIWVDRGCRADFRVWTGGGFEGRPVIVACNSDDERLNRCRVGEGIWNVRLRSQYSGSPCVLGESWGFDDDEIWVNHGCRADFFVFAGGGFARRSTLVRCKSDDERLNRCRIEGDVVNVRLEQQNSGSPCIQGQTWGFDDDGIWVDRGCRAEFRVWTRR